MKLLLIAALTILALAHAEGEAEHEYVFFPDGDGVPKSIDLKEKYFVSAADNEHNVNSITFNLFTRNNSRNGQVLTLNSASSVSNSHFCNSRPTRFVTHGWISSQNAESCTTIRNAYLAVGDYNVIVIDWSDIASAQYSSAASNVRNVAAHVSQFINFLRQQAGLDVGRTQVIGHSLGAHIAGIAARGANGIIEAVVALDPALSGFDSAGAGSAVHIDDASHVQVIHTNGGNVGLMRAIGDSDFYPNGGQSQPGCEADLSRSCDHSRAFYYFAESIQNPKGFRATGVSGVFMGGPNLTDARGSFYLNTHSTSPYALG